MSRESIVVLAVAVVFMAVWLSVFKITYSNSRIRNKLAMFFSSVFGIPSSYAYSIFATIFYSLMPVAGSFLLARLAGFRLGSLYKTEVGILDIGLYTLMGEVAVMAVVSVPLVLLAVASPETRIDKEMQEVNWIAGIGKIPGKWAMLIPCISACCEETFFRGALLKALTVTGMKFLPASVIVTVLFVIGQLVLTKRKIQGYVLGFSSAGISLISCILIGLTGHIAPSYIIHASFAGFYSGNSMKAK